MAYYRICTYCGASLDPDEKCDCQEEAGKQRMLFSQQLKSELGTGQMAFVLDGGEVCFESKSRC